LWQYYTDEHNGYFPVRGSGSGPYEDNGDVKLKMVRWEQCLIDWMPNLDRDILFDPAGTKPVNEGGQYPYAAWPVDLAGELGGGMIFGSYTVNLWAAVPRDDEPALDRPKFYATPSIRGAT
jgi:hypothetical protein